MKNKFLLLPLALTLSLALTSCYDNIYELINDEVPLEEYQINGNISSMAAGGTSSAEYLFLANGKLYKRNITAASDSDITSTDEESSWNKNWVLQFDPAKDTLGTSKTSVDKVIYVAADTTYLYMMTTSWTTGYATYNIEGDRKIWVSSDWGETFTELDLSSLYSSSFDEIMEEYPQTYYNQEKSVLALDLILSNNAPHNYADKRNAYVRLNYHYDSNTKTYYPGSLYKLSGTAQPTEVTSNGAVNSSDSNKKSTTASVVYFPKDGQDYFSPYYAMTANSDYIYFSKNDKYIYYADAWDETNKTFTTGSASLKSSKPGTSTIWSLGATKDYLFVGSLYGAAQVALGTDSVPEASTTNSKVNLTSIFTSSFQVNPVFVYNSSLSIYDTDIWAASKIYGSISTSTHALFNEVGLYAYYPARATWNVDGTADKDSGGN